MKREQLKEFGITDEAVIEKIMAENGKDIEAQKTKIGQLEGEISTAKKNVDDLTGKLKAFDGVDVEKLKNDVKTWETKYSTDTANIKKEYAINDAIKEAKAHDSKAVLPFLDMSLIKLDESGNVIGLKEQLEKIKTDKAFLFEAGDPNPNPNPNPNPDPAPGPVIGTGGSHGPTPPAPDYSKMTDAEYYASVMAEKK